MKFTELNLKEGVLKALAEMGYEDLTPVQEATFGPVLKGGDIMALAETGSGKTSACGIPLVQAVDLDLPGIQALVLVPTRELALQYVDEIDRIAKHCGVKPFAIFGGFSQDIQKAKLKDGVHILIATPGRLIDLIYSNIVSLSNIRTFVLDEADEMLDMGFIEDIQFVMSCMVHSHQTLMFSATMPKNVEKLARQCLDHPEKIQLTTRANSPQSLKHTFAYLKPHMRIEKIREVVKMEERGQVIVFVNSKHSGEKLSKALNNLPSVDYIHGGLEQNTRSSIFSKFKGGKIEVLIATDVAGRGLDFAKVTHVINYDFPFNRESYTHRTGRAGRMGREGTALTFVTPRDLGSLKRLTEATKVEPIWDGTAPDLSAKNIKDTENRVQRRKKSRPPHVHDKMKKEESRQKGRSTARDNRPPRKPNP
jgi:ATP-dependent RNA helicase DeaD